MSLFTLTTLHSCYHIFVKVEEKLKKQGSNFRGRGRGRVTRGRHIGGSSGRGDDNRIQGDSKILKKGHEPNNRGGYGRGRSSYKSGRGRSEGFGRISHFSSMKFYNYGKFGHQNYRFPNKPSSLQGEKKITYV